MSGIKWLAIPLVLIVMLVGAVGTATAIQLTPSSFNGFIQFQSTDSPPIVGEIINAYVPGVTDAVGTTSVIQVGSDLAYAINVLGDESDTLWKDGGVENDLVTFKIGSRIVATGVWISGGNERIDFHPPAADAGGPYVGVVNEPVGLNGTYADAGDLASSCDWDWESDSIYDFSGCGVVNHTWSSAGTKNLTFHVTDLNGGEGTDTATVVVVSLGSLIQTYDGTPKVVSVTGLETPYTADVTYNTLPAAPTNAGSYAIAVSIWNGTTLVGSINKTLTINKLPASVTPNANSKTYGDADPVFTGSLSGFLLADGVSAVYSRTPGESVVGSPYTISATLSPTGILANYEITYNTANFVINARPITVTATPGQTKVYGNTDPIFTYSITSGSLIPGDNLSGLLNRTAGQIVNEYDLTIGTLSGGSNYSITFVPAKFAITTRPITVTADLKTKVYGEVDPTLTYQITSGTLAYSDVFSGNLNRAAGEIVGLYAINQGSLALNSNYVLSYIGANLSITVKPITVTAQAKSKLFGATDPLLTVALSVPLIPGDSFTGALSRVAGETVGVYAIQKGTLALNSNYDMTFVPGTFTINAASVTVTVTPGQTKVYGASDPTAFAFTYAPLTPEPVFTGALSRALGETVGSYAISQGDLTAENFTIDFVGGNFSITQRPITFTADAKTKVYGETDPGLTYQITSGFLVSPDQPTGAISRAVGEPVATYAIGQGTLSLSTNYSLTFVGANFTITPRPITVTADNKTKYFGEADPLLTYQLTAGSLIGSDGYFGALTRTAGEDLNTYAINQGTLSAGDNYNLSFVPGTLTINPLSHSIALVPGWNLVSFNVHPLNTTPASVLSSVEGNFDLVYAWDSTGGHSNSGNWMKYDNIAFSPDSLTLLDETMGFWIRMTAADTLIVQGTFVTPKTIPLRITANQWNLVGFPSSLSVSMPSALEAHGVATGSYAIVYSFRAADTIDQWKLFDPVALPFGNDLTQMTAGWGYWIKSNSAQTWSVDYK